MKDRYHAKLKEKARKLPTKTGSYIMKDSEGRIIYVGKAKNLKHRVSSYFGNARKTPKTEILVSRVADIDFIITANEAEALILENNLIKKYTPRYNIIMKDDKSYPYIQIDFREAFPRIEFSRNVKRNSHKEIFGPFVHGSRIGETIRVITKSFRLRDCSLHEFKSRTEPCLLHHMKQCSAPCVGLINAQDYRQDLDHALDFFRGHAEHSLSKLKKLMNELSSKEQFEFAAVIRDNIETLEEFMKKSIRQNVELPLSVSNFDIFTFYQGKEEVDIAIYLVRNNLLLGHKTFHFPLYDCSEEIEDEVLKLVLRYYDEANDASPERVYTTVSPRSFQLFKKAMYIQSNGNIKVQRPIKDTRPLIKLTTEYALENQRLRLSQTKSLNEGLEKIRQLLQMREQPIFIECFDVAVFQGSSPTASCVVFKNGTPLKASYRHYHLTQRPEGNNDFAMMEELFTRRIERGNLPDLFVVDGGNAQVNVIRSILKEKAIPTPVVGIAKAKTISRKESFREGKITKTEERLIIPGRTNPYILTRHMPLLKIMVHLRNEAHRFSRRLHHKSESKRYFSSWIENIEGIGPKTKKKILEKLDVPLGEIARMPPPFVAKKIGIKKSLAQKIVRAAERVCDED